MWKSQRSAYSTDLAARSAEGAGAPVMAKRAAREDFHRVGGQKPVQKIEVMRRLVDEEAAGVRKDGVPAAKIVGAVLRIEIPVEVDRDDLADRAGDQQLLDALRGRRIAIVEGDVDAPAGAALRFEDAAAVFRGCRHRLFGDHVGAGFEPRHHHVGVGVVGRADDEQYRGGSPTACRRAWAKVGASTPIVCPRALEPKRICIGEPDQLELLRPVGDKVSAPRRGAAVPCSDQRNPFSRRHRASRRRSASAPSRRALRADRRPVRKFRRATAPPRCADRASRRVWRAPSSR